MRFEILHEIEYRYSDPVFLEPHTFFLRPREDHSQQLLDFELIVEPRPQVQMLSGVLDRFGNNPFRAWFRDSTHYLSVKCRSEVETLRQNPFDYLVDPASLYLPSGTLPRGSSRSGVEDFSEQPIIDSGGATLPFLSELCRHISNSFKRIHRPDGGPWPAEETLFRGEGSCRDLAVLFIDCCRAQGLPARFVSGYYEGDPDVPENELHAWCEVYLEGGGWRGFDPSSGLAVTEEYIPVAAAETAAWISPVIGAFRGNGISSRMRSKVTMRRKAAVAA